MAWDFDTREGLRQYVSENGMEKLRELAAGRALRPDRRQFVQEWLAEQDRAEALRAQDASVAGMLAEARRTAHAAERQAKAAERAVHIAWWAFGISALAMIASIAQAIAAFKGS